MADDEMVAWLTGALDDMQARAEYVVEWLGLRRDSPWQVVGMDDDTARASIRVDSRDVAGADVQVAEYLAHHDPRAVLARVEAERMVLASVRAIPTAEEIAAELAWGHRFDSPGFRDEWVTPYGVPTTERSPE